ncbi:MAG: PD-(D/E)XK nuclease family protein, partial [Chloroflexi bacterium]|nr:PD-(D/E)XK nuclease family protein [Chloroflexota bacterium]
FDGDLTGAAAALARRYAPEKAWSASRLEAYRTCPLSFWVGSVLGLEPRPEPAEGPDARQLGNLYHRILEEVYRAGGDDADGDAGDALLAGLPEVARRVLDAAPQVEGFRETPWWLHTRIEIEENVRRTIVALAEMADGFRPLAFEARFFAPHELCLEVDGVCLRVHGLIDRVDVSADGRLRVIDYKTAGPTAFTRAALERGDKLQLPLYALAARDALGLGEPVDGFYWHVPAAKPSPARLARCDGGAEAAMERAARVAAEVAAEVVAGRFPPRPPAEGCPPYCAAEPFCWHYRARRG